MPNFKKLSTSIKIVILLFVTGLCFNLISFISYKDMTKMKQNVDAVYFGVYIQILHLKDINEQIGIQIPKTLIAYNSKKLSPKNAHENLNKINSNIIKSWSDYANSYKTNQEKPRVNTTTELISHTLSWISDLQKQIRLKKQINIPQVYSYIGTVSKRINDMMHLEKDSGWALKQHINSSYEETIKYIFVILITSFVLIVGFSFFIIKNIKDKETQLVKTSKKLNTLNEELRKLSITDSLTELYNRRFFNINLKTAIRRCLRDKKHLSFLMIDIDYYKHYNDAYGHLKGDDALKTVSKILQSCLKRPDDYLFRLGGEEFGVITIDSNKDQTKQLAQIILDAICAAKLEHKASEISPFLTVSIGLISLVPNKKTSQDLIFSLADKALYKAKENGRNRFEAAVFDDD